MPDSAPLSAAMPELRLAQLPAMAARLVAGVREAGFRPDVVVYVERGARLLAAAMCDELGCGAVAVTAQRKGGVLKRMAAKIAGRLPRDMRDRLRRADERWLWRGEGAPRDVTSEFSGRLDGLRALIVDDAADSGRTIAGCRAWLAQRGVAPGDARAAVLAATTPAGRAAVDFWVLDRNTRLPWSADSAERSLAEALYKKCVPPAFAAGSAAL